MRKITFVLTFLSFSFGFAQTFTDTNGPYNTQGPGGGTAATCGTANELDLPITVTGIGVLGTTNNVQSVTVNINHTWNADVRLSLTDPTGTITLDLINTGVGGNGDNFVNCTFIDGGATLPTLATSNITGNYAPQGAGGFANFNNAGVNADGDWVLNFCDSANGDVGQLLDWSITFAPTPQCESADIASSVVVEDCANSQFFVDVDITSIGDATAITDGTNSWPISGTGVTVAGPFVNGSVVSLSVVHSDVECNFGLGSFTFACPPANDNACDATVVSLGDVSTGNAYSNVGATTEAGEIPGACWFTQTISHSVWFSFTLTNDTDVRISTKYSPAGTLGDTQLQVFTATNCADLSTFTSIACDEDDDENVVSTFGLQAVVDINALAPGTYYVQVDGFGNGVGTFDFGVTDRNPLSVEDVEVVDNNAFTFYPNPVQNSLNLKAQSEIQSVVIFNYLGQAVIKTAPNSMESEIDMQSLNSGTYFAQVTINNVTKTIKVLKQ